MQPMNVLVIDGQGGGLGRQLVAALSTQCPETRLTAVGTNSLAANAENKKSCCTCCNCRACVTEKIHTQHSRN